MSTNTQNTDITLVKAVKDSTNIINKDKVKYKLKELELAYKHNDRARLYALSEYFDGVNGCMGEVTKEELQESLKNLKKEAEKNGTTPLNTARQENISAKLSLIKYKPLIVEAANYGDNNDYARLDKRLTDRRTGVIIGVAITTVLGLLSACGIKNNIDNKTTKPTTTNSTTTTSTSDTEVTATYSSEDIKEVYESTNEGYSVETLDIDYSSPTRETTIYTDATGGTYVDTNRSGSKTSTTKSIRPTTKKDQVDVISKPTNSSDPLTYETTAVETNKDGVKVDGNGDTVPTTSHIEPKGSDTLPVEPTKKTLSQEELMGETTKAAVKVLVYKWR